MKSLSKYIGNSKVWKLMFIFGFWSSTLSNLWLIHIFQELINSVSDTTLIFRMIKKFIFVLILNIMCIIIDQIFLRMIQNYGEINLKQHIYKKYLFDIDMLNEGDKGVIISNFNQDIPVISNWISIGTLNTYMQLIYLFLCIGLMAYYSIELTITTVIFITVIFLFAKFFSQKEAYSSNKVKEIYETISARIYNGLLNNKVLRQLKREDYAAQRLQLANIQTDFKRFSGFSSLSEAMLSFMTDVLPILVFFLGILLSSKGRLSTGVAFSLLLIAQKLNEPIIILAELLSDKKTAEKVYLRIKDLFMSKKSEEGEKTAEKFRKLNVRINHFSYSEERMTFRNVYLDLEENGLYVLQGESGRGKSTLLKIIGKIFVLNKEEGEIVYNGENINNLKNESYYQHVLLVEQNTILIEGTLKENLLLGDSFSEEEIQEAIYVSCLEEFLIQKGYDYRIKENGENISGGERQRLGLARMLLRKPDILLLDELGGNLDGKILNEMTRRLIDYKQRYNFTIVAVTHTNEFDGYSPKTIKL